MKQIIMIILAVVIFTGVMLAGCGARSEDPIETATEELEVTFLDVGKGDCILIRKGEEVTLIDTGYADTVQDVISELKSLGIATIDHLIITHYDKDHVGGAAGIVQNFMIGEIYLPGYEGSSEEYSELMAAIDELDLPATVVTSDLSLVMEGADVTIYATDVEYIADTEEEEGNDNDVSLVVSLIYQDDSYLFAGDLEKEGIAAYLENHAESYDIVKMPHHGQKAGNSEDFIAAIDPQIAVITDSEDDPAEEKVLELLEEEGAQIYMTKDTGTIIITGNGTGSYEITYS